VISWTSSSSRGPALLLLACACAAAPRRPPSAPGPIAVFPPVNLSGIGAPVKELRGALDSALRAQRIPVIDEAVVEAFLAKHRVRYTGGVDREVALAARAELGAESILIASLELYQREGPPKLGVGLRLVTAGDDPGIAWIASEARAGDQSPGPFDLGLVNGLPELRADVLRRLAGALKSFLAGAGTRARGCEVSGRFLPRSAFRSPRLGNRGGATVAVLPFANDTQRRSAGDLLALESARQLSAAGFRVIEPGIVRDELLRYRIVMENGLSLDTARVVSELLHADLVIAGYVRDYSDAGVPVVDFTAIVLDRQNNEILWQSTSYNRGDDGVWFFDAGMVSTASALTCRMVAAVAHGIAGNGASPDSLARPLPPPAPEQPVR
jgi:hypothetical protein